MNTINNPLKDFLYFRASEIILFIIYLLLGGLATIKQPEFGLGAFMFGTFGYIFFIIEHKKQLILDKQNGVIICKEKALFLPLEKINTLEDLSNISNAYIATVYDRTSSDGSNHETYKLALQCKNQKTIYPLGNISTNDKPKYENMSKTINNFLRNQDSLTLEFNESPFFFRLLFGAPFSFIYILVCLFIISPETMTPLFEHILDLITPILEANGIHRVQ